MSGFTQAVRNLWRQGDDEYAPDETDTQDPSDMVEQSPSFHRSNPAGSGYSSGSSGGSYSGRRLRPIPSAMRSREKNIYTLKPKSQEDAAIAADYLKTGAAVIVNLEEVDRLNAVRIIDFMSGVCYGLDGQGHAMKLGEAIFLYTPAEFEISSDETDYGENPDFFFKEVTPIPPQSAMPPPGAPPQATMPQAPYGAAPPSYASSSVPPSSIPPAPAYQQAGERRSWER